MYKKNTKDHAVHIRHIAKIWLMIRLITIILIATLMQASAASFAQKITLSRSNASLKGVMKELGNQSGYIFLFTETQLKMAKPVNLKVDAMDFEEVLERVFDSQPLTYTINEKTIILREKERPLLQKIIGYFVDIDVKGRLVDENKQPLVGASVKIKGTNRIVISNEKGEFSLSGVDETAVLVISSIGFESREMHVRKDMGDIELGFGTNKLDEVKIMVSTGYQTLPKERSTGSFSTVSKELFNQQVGTDILSRLPAIANGMVVDNVMKQGRPQLMIRGLSTISGPKDPLVVVDNFPYDGDINNINPNMVESVTILKDASASSIWGARAANGVIVITTKTGKYNQPITLSFNSNLTVGANPDLGDIRQMSSSDYIDLEQELFTRNFYNSQINSSSRPVISPVVDLLNKARTGTITSAQAQQQIDQWRNIDARDDFEQYMYKPSVNQQYFLNALGGTDRFSWTSAAGYDHNRDNLGATYQRVNLRFQNTYRPIKQLSLSAGLLYTQNNSRSGRLGYSNVYMKGNSFVPYMQMADADGNALAVAKNYNPSYLNGLGGGNLLDWNYYPLTDWQHQTSKSNTSDILATATADYKIFKGLSAIVNYQYERQVGLGTDIADPESYSARIDYINRFSQIVNGNVVYIIPKGSILDKSNSVLNANNLRGQLSFDRTYNKHSITAIAGAEMRSVNSNYHAERFYGYNPNNLTTGSVDYTRTYPTVPSGSAYIPRNQALRETVTRYTSQFANAAYTFDQRYVLSVSARRDASNLFGVNANDLWNPFWSAGLAWKLSNEKFYKLDFLPYLNLRATYGLSGNIDPSMVAVNTITYATNNSTFNGEPVAYFNNYYNPLLKWETSKMLDLAVDFRLKNNRLSGSVEYYHKKGENLFGAAPIDYTTGIPPTTIRNVASMRGNGWDLELKSQNIDGAFKWQTIFNYSIYRDKVTEYLIDRTLARNYVTTATPISGIKDKPVYAIFAYQWAGLDPVTGEARGYLNGEVSKDYSSITGVGTKVEDLEFFGSAIPTHFGSMINNLSYRNLSLQIGVSFKAGYWFRRRSINYTSLFNNWLGHSDYALRWQKPGDEANTNVPINQYNTNTNRDAFYESSSVLVEKGDHVRLQYINLAYDFKFPSKGANRFKSLQIYFNANNLGLLWKANKAGLDPDFNVSLVNLKNPANYSLGLRTNL